MPNSPLGRPAADIDAEVNARLDLLPAVAKCCFCPTWSHAGAAAECRQAAQAHRTLEHPDVRQSKRRRGNVSKWNPGREEDRIAGEANAASVAVMLAQRSASQAA